MSSESLEVLFVTVLVVLWVDNRHAGWEIAWTNNIDSNAEIASRELGGELMGEGNGGGSMVGFVSLTGPSGSGKRKSYSLSGVVVELTPLTRFGDA